MRTPNSPRNGWRLILDLLLIVSVIAAIAGISFWLIQAGIALLNYVGPKSDEQRNEFIRTIVQGLGAIVLVAGLYFTWNTLLENQKANRERERISQEGLITDRYTKAVEQLGATDSAGNPRLELRLGGIYALQRIARDSERDHWPIMQLLAAYVSLNASFRPTDYQQMHLMLEGGKGIDWLRENRPRADIQAIAHVFLHRGRHLGNGEPLSFDLDHCDLHGVQFFSTVSINLEYSNFSFSNLTMASLAFAKLQHANFAMADLTGLDLNGAECEQATFLGSRLFLAKLRLAHLEGANFAGANLNRANFEGAYLRGSNIEEANSLEGAVMYLATGLTDEQRRQCAAKGAFIEATA